MFGLIGSALSAAGSWLGGAVSGITGAVSSLVSNPAVQKAAGAAISAFVPKPAPSKPKPAPKIRSEKGEKEDDGDKNTMLYIALGGVALIAIVLLMKR